MKVLLSSNLIGSPTGYGVQSGHLLPRLRDQLGHEVAQFAWWGIQGQMTAVDGIPVYPRGADRYGNDICGQHARHFGADLVVTLIDCWVHPLGFHASLGGIPWAPWSPTDHSPVGAAILARLKQAEYPLQFSQFGMQEMRRAGVPATYIPLGVETQHAFVPGDKRAARAALHLPQEAFLCTMVAANKGHPSRKAFAEQLQAFVQFRKRHPDAVLYLHTQLTAADGVRLDLLCQAFGLGEGVVYWPDQYDLTLGLPEEWMAQLYQASDVLLAATCAEGFGIPIVEAQACGTPVITTDFSSMPELTVNGITTSPAQLQWYQLPPWQGVPSGGWQAVPSVAAIAQALTDIYGWGTMKRQRNAAAGRTFVVDEYDWDACVARYWRPFLARVEQGRDAGAPPAPQLVEVGA